MTMEKIKVAIVDDNKENIESLVDFFIGFPEIEVVGYASQYRQALKLLTSHDLNLVFLDVEMPCKNGFELLEEVRSKGCAFSVVFYTAYDKYVVQALRESAFDYLVKPVDPVELKGVVNRYHKKRAEQTPEPTLPVFKGINGVSEIVALPSNTGLRFIDKNRLLLFRCAASEGILKKPCWEALLTDRTTIKLGYNTSADRILHLLNKDCFIPISQSCIINLNYLSAVEFKTRRCIFIPPFDTLMLTVSRSHLSTLRELYDVL